ncbi:MAG: GGDEF domain-containing protein [Gammaproteobacteria bacterium]|nr:GGDEF domain-containing protein [Gammaproteobacteria bacterium]
MNNNRQNSKLTRDFFLVALLTSLLFWLVDSTISYFIFHKNISFADNLFFPDFGSLLTRIIVVIIIFVLAFIIKRLLAQNQALSSQIKNYQKEIFVKDSDNLDIKKASKTKSYTSDLKKLTNIDPVTLLFNKHKFKEILKYAIEVESTKQSGLSVILCAIDQFEHLSKTLSANEKNQFLLFFATLISHSVRKSDIVARWSDDEFILLIPDTQSNTTKEIAELLRKRIEISAFFGDKSITSSFGVTYFISGDNSLNIIKRAADALYRAKSNGNNSVELTFR